MEPSLLVRKNATSEESARSSQRAIWREYGVLNRFEVMQGGGEGITLADKGDRMGRGRELFSGRSDPGDWPTADDHNAQWMPPDCRSSRSECRKTQPIAPPAKKIFRTRRSLSRIHATVAPSQRKTMPLSHCPTALSKLHSGCVGSFTACGLYRNNCQRKVLNLN